MTTKKYPAIAPHGPLTKVSDNVYVVQGSFKMGPGLLLSLTMTIVKRESELTIVNSMRVGPEVEEEIKALGDIKSVVRICSNHGASDEYYVDTFGATYYDLPLAAETPGASKVPATDKLIENGSAPPSIPDAKLVILENLKMPDAVLYLPDDGGTLICGDFIQNGIPSPHESFLVTHVLGKLLGFNTGLLTCPPPFFKFYGDGKDVSVNVAKIMEMDFDTVITAHGPYVKGGAKEKLKVGFDAVKKDENLWKSP